MENWDARQSQHIAGIDDSTEHNWNIVELESRRHLRSTINALIHLTIDSTLTTVDLQHQLSLNKARFGSHFSLHLVRALSQHKASIEREAIVYLLTLLNDEETLPLLRHMAQNERLSRAIRLSASLALAGMGATHEMSKDYQPRRFYAIS